MATKRGGLSQNEAADRAGVTRTLWRQMEDPERPYRPRRRSIVKVARFLGWDLQNALQLAGHPEPPTDAELAEMRRGPRDDLDQKLRLLNESQIRALDGIVEVMLNPNAPPRLDEDPGNEEPRPVFIQEVQPGSGDILGAQHRVKRRAKRR